MLVISRNNNSSQIEENNGQMLSSRMDNPLCKFNGYHQVLREGDHTNNQDTPLVKSIKLPYIERLPPYTFWTHLARNEKMTEDESVVKRSNIYYDHHGGETVICSDSDEEFTDDEEDKCDFSQGEDQLIRMVFEKYGSTNEVSSIIRNIIGGTNSEIQERYKFIKENDQHHEEDYEEDESFIEKCLKTSLSAALDDVGHFFCRQCMTFDCSLHGCSQELVYPSEKQPAWTEQEGDGKPCGDHCYLLLEEFSNQSTKAEDAAMEWQVENKTTFSNWKPLEKDLYKKGIEMFGKNSCLISRNLLSGWKTCMEVATYMSAEVSMPQGSIEEIGKVDAMCIDNEMPSRSLSLRRKGKSKFKYTSKSAGLPFSWKRINDGENQIYKQYTPCECEGHCGKQCSCVLNGSCCEKYCGCSKLCRNRFGGCHCIKSQCRTRHCPCFAAARECDADVCRNCWISCGDGLLGESSHRADSQCGNMMILLGKKQRILLAKSDVAGWGAFLKNPANKNDFLGEYTGELISQIEAEKRGKLYDRADFSFLFNLNDEYVLDAYRKGDKLKFANHSSKPNCYAKIMLVAGDHRVGIYAKERIEAGEELFYDYRYGPNQKPPWLLKLLSDDSDKNDSTTSQGKPKKHQSQ
ncbi:histone-lysine N-methyltransferase EZA1-like [Cicer arietinum]